MPEMQSNFILFSSYTLLLPRGKVRLQTSCIKGCQNPNPCWTRQIQARPDQPWARCSVFIPPPAGANRGSVIIHRKMLLFPILLNGYIVTPALASCPSSQWCNSFLDRVCAPHRQTQLAAAAEAMQRTDFLFGPCSSPRLELVRGYSILSASGNKGFRCPTLPD